MEVSKLRRILDKYAASLGENCAPTEAVEDLVWASANLSPFDRLPVRKLIELAKANRLPLGGAPPRSLELLADLLATAGAKVASRTVRELARSLADAGGMSIRDIVRKFVESQGFVAPDDSEDLVGAYVRELQSAVHNPVAFPRVFSQLAEDKRLSRSDVVAVASAFAFRMAASTSRREALRRIASIHESSEGIAAKARAMDGKTAA